MYNASAKAMNLYFEGEKNIHILVSYYKKAWRMRTFKVWWVFNIFNLIKNLRTQ